MSADPRYQFIRGDIASVDDVRAVFEKNPIDTVVNFAAETHVDRSIEDSLPFLQTNIMGTRCLLEHSRGSTQ